MALPRIRITGREERGDYRVFRVDRLTLEMEGTGPSPTVRTRDAFVFRTESWCNVVALTPDEQVVFVRQFRFGIDADTLEIPGGVVDPGESPHDAAIRELREETGFEAGKIEPLVKVHANPAIQDTWVHSFVARDVVPSAGGVHFDEYEACELVLIPLAELEARIDAGEFTHSLCRLPLEVFLRKQRAHQPRAIW